MKKHFLLAGIAALMLAACNNKPMGVATYRTSKDMPERLRNALPDIEELRKLL